MPLGRALAIPTRIRSQMTGITNAQSTTTSYLYDTMCLQTGTSAAGSYVTITFVDDLLTGITHNNAEYKLHPELHHGEFAAGGKGGKPDADDQVLLYRALDNNDNAAGKTAKIRFRKEDAFDASSFAVSG